MGATESRAVHVFNGTRYILQVTLDGKKFDYRKSGVSPDLRTGTSVKIGNGGYVQIFLPEKYMKMTLECNDDIGRQVKYLVLYTQDDCSWVARDNGVMRPKPGTVGLTGEEDYTNTSSDLFKERGGLNWKKDFGDKIRFHNWDVDNQADFAKKEREDIEELEDMRDRERSYGRSKNWIVLVDAFHPKTFSKPDSPHLDGCLERGEFETEEGFNQLAH